MSCRLSVIQHPTAHCGLSDASPPSHFFGGLLLQQLAICWFWHPAVAGTEPWPSRRRRPEAMGWEDNGGHLNAAELRVPLLRINLQGLVLLRPQAGREISPNVTQQPILHLRPPTSPKAYILHPGIQTLPACTIWQSSTSNPGGTSTLVFTHMGCGNLLCAPGSQDPGLRHCMCGRSLCQEEPEVPLESMTVWCLVGNGGMDLYSSPI